MLKLPRTFVFLVLKGQFFDIPMYGLLLVNGNGQIDPGHQNDTEITL